MDQDNILITIQSDISSLKEAVKELTGATKDIVEIIGFVRDNAVTKQHLDDKISTLDSKIDNVRDELKNEIRETRNEMLSHVDGFAGLAKTQEMEITALVARVERNEAKLDAVIKQLDLQIV